MKLVLFDPKTEECLAESEEEMWDYLGEYLNQDNIKNICISKKIKKSIASIL